MSSTVNDAKPWVGRRDRKAFDLRRWLRRVDMTRSKSCIILFVMLAIPALISMSLMTGPLQSLDETAFGARIEVPARNFAAIGVFLAVAGSGIAIFLLLYMQDTALGNKVVDGVQGRYFLPFLPALVAFLPKKGIPPTRRTAVTIAVAGWLAFSSIVSLHLIDARFKRGQSVTKMNISNFDTSFPN